MNILLDPAARPVIAHRGNRAHAPENTVESFRQAIELGADALEFDVHLSADGVPVVHHDSTLDRTTDGSGKIALTEFAALKPLDAGARFSPDGGKTFPYRGKGHGIPSLDEVIETFPDIPLLIEIKAPAASVAVRSSLEAHAAEERTVVDSFSAGALDVFGDSAIAYGSSSSGVARLMREVLLRRRITPFKYRTMCVPLNYRGLPLPVLRFAEVCATRDCSVHIWTINDPAKAISLWNKGVNGIITDDPAIMIAARRRLA